MENLQKAMTPVMPHEMQFTLLNQANHLLENMKNTDMRDEKLVADFGKLYEQLEKAEAAVTEKKFNQLFPHFQGQLNSLLKEALFNQYRMEDLRNIYTDFPEEGLLFPSGFSLKSAEGYDVPQVIMYESKKEVIVMPVPFFPVHSFRPVSGAKIYDPELMQIVYYDSRSEKWIKSEQLVKRSALLDTKHITDLANIGISVSTENARCVVKFMHSFLDINVSHTAQTLTSQKYGWIDNVDGPITFAPYFGNVKVMDSRGADRSEILIEHAGTLDSAVTMIRSMKDNLVFQTMLAGMIAGPVVSLAGDYGAENIGIDLSSKTSTGKSTIQKIAFQLVYGDVKNFILSWQGATANGIWGMADLSNHIPFILDDSHLIIPALADVPHALINGAQGNKQFVNKVSGQIENRETRSFRSVVFFNGEVPLGEQALISSSRGLIGRVIMIKERPFPFDDSTLVQLLLNESYNNRGQLIRPWLDFLSGYNSTQMVKELHDIEKKLQMKEGGSPVYQRLAKKAAILLWSLEKANELFDFELDTDILIPFLMSNMADETEEVDMLKIIVRDVVEYVIQNSGAGESFNVAAESWKREGLNSKGEGDNDFVIKTKVFERIVAGRRKTTELKKELYKEGYIYSVNSEQKAICMRDSKGDITRKSSTSGIRFNKIKIREQLGIDMNSVDIASEITLTDARFDTDF